jgi:hypothetical protein
LCSPVGQVRTADAISARPALKIVEPTNVGFLCTVTVRLLMHLAIDPLRAQCRCATSVLHQCPTSERSSCALQEIVHAIPLPMTNSTVADIAVIGVDIGKNAVHVAGLDKSGMPVLRQVKLPRGLRETETRWRPV